jgi:P4 family phage/plasmid primase-like protien
VTPRTPEAKAALWKRLAALAGAIGDEETRAQYRAEWRARYDATFPPPPPGLSDDDMLPDGSVGPALSEQGAGAQATLRRVHAAWLRRERERPTVTDKQANGFAFALGRRMRGGLIDFFDGEEAFADFDPDDYDMAAMQASFWAGVRKGYDLTGDLVTMRCAAMARTDMGNAERFRERFGRDFLYTTAKGWLGYDGRRYRVLVQEKDATPAEVLGAVFSTIRSIQDESKFVSASGFSTAGLGLGGEAFIRFLATHDIRPVDVDVDGALDRGVSTSTKVEPLSKKLAGWGISSESSGHIGCIANLVRRWVTVDINDFDTDPMLLNCHNGTLRFLPPDDDGPARVELVAHDRDHMLTKLTACAYDPEADADEWQKLLVWAQPKKERRRYLRQWLGYCLTGDVGEQIFHIWWGPTAANGKSTVGNAARDAAGDYGEITNVETFLDEGIKKRGDQATPDIVRLPGVRFLTSGEPGPGSKFNEPLINSVTGGDPMLARDNFRSFFRFVPVFKWTIWCNKKPDIVQGTEGIWRRAKVLLWESHLEPHEKDRTLPARLAKEHAGILAWMVRGAIDWMQHGFVEPEDVTVQSLAYRDDSDPLASFLRLCTAEDEGARTQSSVLYKVYCGWCKAAGENPWSNKGLTRAMKDRGFDNKASNGIQWLGFRLTKHEWDFIDEKGEVRADIDLSIERNGPPGASDGGARAPPGAEPWPPDDDTVPL